MPNLIHEKYPRIDALQKVHIIDIFKKFLKKCQQSNGVGQVLNIVSYLEEGSETGLGGLGKTHETWNLLEFFKEKKELEVIDLSADKDSFGYLEEVVFNLRNHLQTKEAFQNFEFIKNQNTEVLPNTLSKLAWSAFKKDLLKITLPPKGKNSTVLLFFDSLDWVVDDELLKSRKTFPTFYKLNELKSKDLDKDSLLYWLIGKDGLFETLLKKGISIVVTGRYKLANIAASSNKKSTILTTEMIKDIIYVGEFSLDDLKAYIRAELPNQPEKFPSDIISDTVLLKLLGISKRKPVLSVFVADLMINQFKKNRPKTIDEKILQKIIKSKIDNHVDVFEHVADQLFEVTGGYESSKILEAATLAFYRLDLPLAQKMLDHIENESTINEICERMSNLSVIKRYPHKKTKKPIEFLRPHDDILAEFHQYYWARPENREDKIKKYKIIKDHYQQSNTWAYEFESANEDEDIFRRRLELYYLTYLFESVEDAPNKLGEDLERACRYAQYLFIENIDQHADHAERVLSRAEIYLPFEKTSPQEEPRKVYQHLDASRFVVWLALRRIEYWLTERNADTEKLAEERMTELALYVETQIGEKYRNHLAALVDGYWGELFTWRNELKKAKDRLEKTALDIYHLGDNNSLAWIRHLQGFLFNRQANFSNSILFNTAAIEASLPFLMEKAKGYYEDTESKKHKIFFATDEAKSFAFRRMLRVLLRSIGNLSAAHRYSGHPFLSVKYSYGQIYIWHAVPHADREIARAYANLMTAMNDLELEELIKSLGIHAGRGWLTKFEKDSLIQIRLIYADALRYFKQGGLGYTYVYLPEAFLKEVNKIHTKEDRSKNIQKALEEVSKGLKVKDLKSGVRLPDKPSELLVTGNQVEISLPREIADLFYLEGKVHLINIVNQKPDFAQAEIAFENASWVACKAGFKILELEALEALLNLALLQGDLQKFELRHKQFQSVLHNSPKYDNVLAKYNNTLGNKLFLETVQLHDEYDYKDEKKLRDKIQETVKHYAQMLDHYFALSQDHYDLGLKVLAMRISNCPSPALQHELTQALIIALKTTQVIKHDRHLEPYVVGVSKRQLLHSNTHPEEKKLKIVEDLIKLQRRFNQRGTLRKSIEINRVIWEYYRGAIAQIPTPQHATPPESTDQNEVKHKMVFLIRAYFRVSNLFQLLNQGRKALASITQAKYFITKQCERLGMEEELNPFIAVLTIAELTTQYRTNEFWVMERFVKGEELHYQERHTANQKYIEKLLLAIDELAKYLTKPNHLTHFQRIIAEGCFRMGELFFLLDDGDKIYNEKKELIEGVFQKLQDLLLKENYSLTEIERRIAEGSNPFLEYARNLAKASRDIYRQVDTLQGIYNYGYFKGKPNKSVVERAKLSSTIKSLALNFQTLVELFLEKFYNIEESEFQNQLREDIKTQSKAIIELLPEDRNKSTEDWKEWYHNLDTDEQRVSLKEMLANCVRFIPDLHKRLFDRSAYDHSFVFAKHKMTLGNEIFSKYFMPHAETYQNITNQWLNRSPKPKKDSALENVKVDEMQENPALEGALFLEKCELTSIGEELLRKHNIAKETDKETEFGRDFRQMMRHYLEGLDALKSSDQHESFEFNQYLLEIQRRFLLMPINEPIQAILDNIDAGFYQFPRLYKNLDMLREILWTLKARYIGICLQEIYQK